MDWRSIGLAGLGLALTASVAHAREWTVSVGARAAARPPYEGADDVRIQASPTLRVRRADRPRRFTPPDPGASVDLIDTRHVIIGPVLAFRRRREAVGDLVGLRELRRAVEPGGFVELWPTDWLRGRLEVRRGVLGHSGWVGDAGLDLIYTGRRWDASIGPRMGFGDGRYLDAYFGVTPEEAARSPFIDRAYEPTRGRRYTGMMVAFGHHLTDNWRATVNFGYRRLADKATASPIVRTAGSGDYFTGGVGVSYRFNVGR